MTVEWGDNRKIVFLFDNGNLIFDADRSDSNSMWGLPEGAVFIYRDKSSLVEYPVNDNEGEEETNTETNEPVEPQQSEYQGIETELFKEISGEYTYDLILNFGGRFYLSDDYEEPIHGEGAPEGWYALGGEGECIDPSYAEKNL